LEFFLQIFVVFNTLTRGGILSLILSLMIFIGYLAFFKFRSNKIVRNSGIILLLLLIIFTSLVFLNKQADWVYNNNALRRVANISISDTTAENRLVTWQGAYEGFKDKPYWVTVMRIFIKFLIRILTPLFIGMLVLLFGLIELII